MIIYYLYLTFYYFEIKFHKLKSRKNKELQTILNYCEFSLLSHHKVRQKYDKKYPYYFHIKMLLGINTKFDYLINNNYDYQNVIGGICLHDTIEDIHYFSYADIKKEFGLAIADIVYACTEDKGKTRAERHSENYYKGIKENKIALYVKLCDISANITYSKNNKSDMFEKYKSEYPKVKQHLYIEEYNSIFEYIENELLNINTIEKPE